MDFWNSRVQWAMGLVQKHYQSEPKFDSKAFWQWRCATLELGSNGPELPSNWGHASVCAAVCLVI